MSPVFGVDPLEIIPPLSSFSYLIDGESSAVAIGGLAASVAAATCAVRLHVGIE